MCTVATAVDVLQNNFWMQMKITISSLPRPPYWHGLTFSISSLLHRAFRTITSIINQQIHYIKFHIKTLKIAPTCFDPKIILRELATLFLAKVILKTFTK